MASLDLYYEVTYMWFTQIAEIHILDWLINEANNVTIFMHLKNYPINTLFNQGIQIAENHKRSSSSIHWKKKNPKNSETL
jgi:hypothetical protein